MVASSLDALDEHYDETNDRRPFARTENLSALCVNLSKLLEGRGKFVLVLDAVDKLREGGGTLIAALGRLGESVCLCRISRSWSCIVDSFHRYPTSHLFLPLPYLSRLRPCMPPTRLRSTSLPTTARNSSLYSATIHSRSFSRRHLKINSPTTRPISPPKTTPGSGAAS
jgi:hypothetical protein